MNQVHIWSVHKFDVHYMFVYSFIWHMQKELLHDITNSNVPYMFNMKHLRSMPAWPSNVVYIQTYQWAIFSKYLSQPKDNIDKETTWDK